jgi:hypothetical protein
MNQTIHTVSSVAQRLLLLCMLACFAACAPQAGDSEETTVSQVDELPNGCDPLFASGARLLAVGELSDQSGRYLVDTSQGRCTTSRAAFLESLRRRDAHGLAEKLAGRLRLQGTPSPHPDLGSHGARPTTSHGSASTTGDTNNDPVPHPDVDDDADEVVIIIWVVIIDGQDGANPPDVSSKPPDDEPSDPRTASPFNPSH